MPNAIMTKASMKPNVAHASNLVTLPGVMITRTIYNHQYAHIEKIAVVKNTPVSKINFGSSTAGIHTADITNRLNAAEPTIVEGPSSPAFSPSVVAVSIMDKRISGADEPRAISVKFAIVGFHYGTSMKYLFLPDLSETSIL